MFCCGRFFSHYYRRFFYLLYSFYLCYFYFYFSLSEDDEEDELSPSFYFSGVDFEDYFSYPYLSPLSLFSCFSWACWIFSITSNVSFLFRSLLIVSPRHWLLKISFKNSISLSIILLSPKAVIPNSLRSSFLKNKRLSPSILFSLKSSIQSPNPIWLSQSQTYFMVHSFTKLFKNRYFWFR